MMKTHSSQLITHSFFSPLSIMELLTKLGVDWKLLIAQIVNFTILLAVLSYFVYRPLLDLLDARRARIAKAMEDVKRIEEQNRRMEELRVEQLKKVDQEVGAMLERAKRQAETMRDEILTGARRDADTLLDKGRRQLEDDRVRVMNEAQKTLAAMIVRMTEKILEREFSPNDQERLLHGLEKDIPSLLR